MRTFEQAQVAAKTSPAPTRAMVRDRSMVTGQDDCHRIIEQMLNYYLFRFKARPASDDGTGSGEVVTPPAASKYERCRLRYVERRLPLTGLLGDGQVLRTRSHVASIASACIGGMVHDAQEYGNDPTEPAMWVLVAWELLSVDGTVSISRPREAGDKPTASLDPSKGEAPAEYEGFSPEVRRQVGLDDEAVESLDKVPLFVVRFAIADVFSDGPWKQEASKDGGWIHDLQVRHRRPAQSLISRVYGVADISRVSISTGVAQRVLRMKEAGLAEDKIGTALKLTPDQVRAILTTPTVSPENLDTIARLYAAGEPIEMAVLLTGLSESVVAAVWPKADKADVDPPSDPPASA